MSAGPGNRARFRIGIVCEGQRGCAETQVFPHLVRLICPEAICGNGEIVPSGNRPNVLSNAPAIAKQLVNSGCVAVFVIWDVFPEWRDQGGTTDCKVHRKTLEENLAAAQCSQLPVIAIAIREELEAWLLCDAGPLMEVIGPLTSRRGIQHQKHPDNVSNPKQVLEGLFRFGRGKSYNPSFSAGLIASKLISTSRLRRSQSFSRFEERVRALCNVHRR